MGGSFLRKEEMRLLFHRNHPRHLPTPNFVVAPQETGLPSISNLNFGSCLLLKSSRIFSPFTRSTLVVMAATSPVWSLATVWSQGPVKRGEQGPTSP